MKKRNFLFASGLALALLLTACGGKTASSTSSSESQNKSSGVQSSEVPSSSKEDSSVEPISSSVQPVSSSESAPSSQQSSQQSTGQQSSNNSSGQSSSSQEVATTVYYALYDGREIALEAESAIEEIAGLEAVYRGNLGNITKGKSISILNSDKQPLSESFNAEDGDNNVTAQDGGYVIHNDATNAFVLVKIWDTPWTNFYVSGYVADQIPEVVFKVLGANDEWNYAANTAVLVDATDAAEVAEGKYDTQLKVEFDVDAADYFKINDGEAAWYGYEVLEDTCKENFNSDDNGNIVAKYDGHVELFLKFKNGGANIFINFTKDEAPAQHVNLTVQVAKDAGEGNAVYIIGDFCEWQIANALKMTYDSVNSVWTTTIDAVVGQAMAYKLALAPANNPAQTDIVWEMEGENNRSYTVTAESGNAPVVLVWGNPNPTQDPIYKIVGTMNEWSYENSAIAFEDATDPEQVAHGYYVSQAKAIFQVEKGSQFKLVDQESNYIGGEKLHSTDFFNVVHSEDASNNNIKANFNGEATLYLKTLANDTKEIYIDFIAVIPEQCYFIYDGQEIVLNKLPAESTSSNDLAVYAPAETQDVVKDKPIAFLDEDKQPFTGTCIPSITENNVVEVDGFYFIHNTRASVPVMLFLGTDGRLIFYVGGYEIPEATYTVIDVPTWVDDNDATVFAWVWSDTDSGSWHAASFVDGYDGTEISFVAAGNIKGFLLVRCAAGTTAPNWEVKGDATGRIYNKTGDVNIAEDTIVYFCPEWQQYNP